MMQCVTCGEQLNEVIDQEYQYSECGIENVVLKNITIYTCSCGEIMPSIPQILELHKAIAKAIIGSWIMVLEEKTFLRKELDISKKVSGNWVVKRENYAEFICTYKGD